MPRQNVATNNSLLAPLIFQSPSPSLYVTVDAATNRAHRAYSDSDQRGGGGGGGGGTQKQIANDAALAASDRLFNPDCAGLFLAPDANTPQQRKILAGQLEYAVDQGDVRVISQANLPAGTPANVPAFTTGLWGFIYVVSERSFFTGKMNGKSLGGAFEGLTLNQTQQLMMIHEFLHWEGLGRDDANQLLISVF